MSKRFIKPWLTKEEIRLRELRSLGWTCRQIATELRRGLQSVRMKLIDLGIKKTYPLNDLVLILQQPHDYQSLSEDLDMRPNTLAVYKRRMKKRGLAVWDCQRKKLIPGKKREDYH